MSFTPLFVVNGTTYTVTELENLVTNYENWQQKYYNSEQDKQSLITSNLSWKNKYEDEVKKAKVNSNWDNGYKAGLEDAIFLVKQQKDRQTK